MNAVWVVTTRKPIFASFRGLNPSFMIRTLVFLYLALPGTLMAQDRIGKNKTDLRSILENFVTANAAAKPALVVTDSTFTLSVIDPGAGPVQYRYGFDKSGICITETISATCDSCYKMILQGILDREGHQWKKLNENQWVSKFEDHLLIELPVDPKQPADYFFTIFKTDWSRDIYNMLLKN